MQPNETPARAQTALTPEQLVAVQKFLDAILATAPQKRPPRWDEIPDNGYTWYMSGKEYMLWDLAQMLRKAIDTPPAPVAGREEGDCGSADD